ncbi:MULTISPECIES: hypothetical protein [unclassified Frondihabitans]|uniref:hypothetical protein n=1 Tax=unclassified Frondihabitans TaxID=2626248 RepID=UPI000F51410B|nr:MULTISPECIES: hypothetical protein [unclassified Frondihabitans]RPE74382.1 hypothetical protein EDF37_3123 [Frondihabitans sp. PhB153]RPF02811.1 hypothetical protein EDF39_3191 [Frondihabitans sp. PhB161]
MSRPDQVGSESVESEPVDSDDEALSWGTSSDKSYVEGPATSRDSSAPDDEFDDEEDDDELPEGVLSSGMLVAHGVFGALLLLYTVAWLRGVGSVQPSFDSTLAAVMWRIGTWLAVAAPAIWFAATVWLVPTTRSRTRILSFIAAVVILVPWPFVIGNLL